MTRCLLSVSLLAQGSEAMRDPTKTLEEPSKASLADPVPSGDAPARRLDAAKTRGFKEKDELKDAVKAWLDKDEAGWADYGEIKIWDVSRITDMSSLFYGKQQFNDDISKWDTARVTSMRGMFTATKFNDDISKWDTARVKDMNYMFTYAQSFNQDLGWCVSSTVKPSNSQSFLGFVEGTPCEPTNCGITFMNECPTPAPSLAPTFPPSLAPTPGYCNSYDSEEICDAMPCCMWDGIVCGDDLLCNSYGSEEGCNIVSYCMWDGNSCTAAEWVDGCGGGPPQEDMPPEYDPNVPPTEAGGSGNNGKAASPDVIVVACVAAAVLLVAALFVWNKRAVAHKQPHRETSMLTIGREDREGDVEVAESADQ